MEMRPTFVFLSTHSSQLRVGLFRFCFFLGGGGSGNAPSSCLNRSIGGDAIKVLSVVAGEIAYCAWSILTLISALGYGSGIRSILSTGIGI